MILRRCSPSSLSRCSRQSNIINALNNRTLLSHLWGRFKKSSPVDPIYFVSNKANISFKFILAQVLINSDETLLEFR